MNNGNSTGGKAINWATVVLVIVTGGGNWLETKAGNNFNAEEIKRATQEIHDLYPRIAEAIDRQKRLQETLDSLNKKIP